MGAAPHPYGDPCCCDKSGPPAPAAARLARASGMARLTLPAELAQQVAVVLTAAATIARARPHVTVRAALRTTGADAAVTRAAAALVDVLDDHPHLIVDEVRALVRDPDRDAAYRALDAAGNAA